MNVMHYISNSVLNKSSRLISKHGYSSFIDLNNYFTILNRRRVGSPIKRFDKEKLKPVLIGIKKYAKKY